MGWIVGLVLVGAIIALPFVIEARRPSLTKARRRAAPGRFADLSDGRTHYEWHGPVDGPVLVCIHGLTTPSVIWGGMMRGLTQMGYRVLTYDLYGRGFSDVARRAQTRSFHVNQLRELLDALDIEEDFTLMGFSMGGMIASIYAAEAPERVERLFLVAPAGLGYSPAPLERVMRRVPALGHWLALGFMGRMIRGGLASLRDEPPGAQDIRAAQIAQTRQRGFATSVLSSMRHMLGEDLTEEMAEIKVLYVPVLAIWGEADTAIPASAIGRLAEINRDARQVTIAEASHWLPATHPREVLAAIQEFRREV